MVNQSIELIGGIDILVNCAAKPLGQKKSGIEDKSLDEKIIEEINIKVMGYLRCSRAVIPFMKQNGWGRIINIAGLAYRSSGNIVGSLRNVSVSALTKILADELGPPGINVSVIHPGFTITERTENLVKSMAKERTKSINDIWNEINQNNSVKPKIFSNDFAYLATILASPKSIAINGDGIAAGGGVSDSIYY
jgi:Dehydrogenases with different specificities (related to short-chain alcohol dehydrogenases)